MQRRLILAALAASLSLSACSDESDAPRSRPTPTTTTPTATPEPSAPASLTAAPSDETAEQFIRRWVELGNYMQATGDTGPYLAVSGDDCDSCQRFAEKMDRIYKAGGSVTGGREQVVEAISETATQWYVQVDVEKAVATEAPDASPTVYEADRYRTRVNVAKIDGLWMIATAVGVSE